MKVIGLTGQSGSGKGAVSKILSEHGIPHIDCDKVYHSLLYPQSPCTEELYKSFGEGILAPDGSVDRKKLGAIVFGEDEDSKESLELLNSITLKYVIEECRYIIGEHKKNGAAAVTLDAPTLFESGFDSECDVILAVTASYENRLKRITERDGICREAASERLTSQQSEDFYTNRADFIIENNGGMNELKEKTEIFIREILH